jgi:hypothetical protein
MSIGPLGSAASAAGIQLTRTKVADAERAHGEVGAQRRRVYHEQKAEAAAGIGEPDGEDHEIADRNGDGRRPWEEPPEPATNGVERPPSRSRDPSQEQGSLLDLDG